MHAEEVAALATAAGAASVAIVAVTTEWPQKWDIADPLPEGAGPDSLGGLLQSAIPWTPAAPNEPGGQVDDKAEIARLAALSRLQYDREREAAAERLRCRTSTSTGWLQSGVTSLVAAFPGRAARSICPSPSRGRSRWTARR